MDATANGAADTAARGTSAKIARLLQEIDGLIADDEAADRQITGGWRTFADIVAAAHVHTWDAYSVDLTTDAESFRQLPRAPEYESMRAALLTQEHDERMHAGSLLRVATEVLGIDAADAASVAKK